MVRHLADHLRFGYELEDLGGGQQAFVARPEKALLDMVHLTPRGDQMDFLDGLRLQDLYRLDRELMVKLAERAGSPRWQRTARAIGEMLAVDGEA